MNKFMRFHVHSQHSQRDSLLSIKDIVTLAKENNELVSITEHGHIGSYIEYYNECKAQDQLPVFGVEAYVNDSKLRLLELSHLISIEKDTEKKKKLQDERDSKKHNYHLVIVAKNNHGLKNIMKLNNLGYITGFYGRPLITYNELLSLPKDKKGDRGLIISTACLGGTLSQHILKFIETKDKKHYLDAEDFIKMMTEEFGEDFYLEVQSNDIEEQRQVNKVILKLAEKLNAKVCIGIDAHYVDQAGSDTHEDMLLLQDHKTKEDVGKFDIKITWENIKGEPKSRKLAGENSFRKGILAEDVKVGDKFGKGKQVEIITAVDKVPRTWTYGTDKLWYKSEAELRTEVKKYHKELVPKLDDIINFNKEMSGKIEQTNFNTDIKLPSIDDADKKITELLKIKLKEKGLVRPEYVDRVKTELAIIKENNFCNYFLILADIINFAKENGIPCGAGRGSSAGSLIAYLLGIHRIDPLSEAWGGNMDFERFLSESRHDKVMILTNSKGKKIKIKEEDEIIIMRDNTEFTILAKELKIGDNIKNM